MVGFHQFQTNLHENKAGKWQLVTVRHTVGSVGHVWLVIQINYGTNTVSKTAI